MSARLPQVFISATTADLGTSRQVLVNGLLTVGCLPMEQTHFGPDTRTVREMIEARIAKCDAVIHLVGECYGAEPKIEAGAGPRRSYTQLEYFIARELGKRVYLFICGDDFPYDPHAPEPEELRELQQAHRASLCGGEILYSPVSNRDELEKGVLKLSEQVEQLAREVRRTRSWLGRGVTLAAAALLLVALGLWFVKERVGDSTREIAALRADLNRKTAATTDVLAKLEHARVSVGAETADQLLAAQAGAARDRGLTIEQLKEQLTQEGADVSTLLAQIEQRRQRAQAEALSWQHLQREALLRLGDTATAAGRYAEATQHYRKALALVDQKKDPLVWCDTAHPLQAALVREARYSEGESLARLSVEFRSALLGAEHPKTLESMNLLSEFLGEKADPSGAAPLLTRVLEIRERTLGAEHDATLESVTSLAVLLFRKADYAAAEPLARRAFSVRENRFGPEHSKTLASAIVLAGILRNKGDLAGAEPLYRRLMEVCERINGRDHPHTLASVGNLAVLLADQGNRTGAESLLLRALEGRERVLGPEHPETLLGVGNLGSFYEEDGNFAAAEPLLRRALAAYERISGKEHPETLYCLTQLGKLLCSRGDLAEAEPLLQRAFEATERTLGELHPDTLLCALNLGRLCGRKGDVATAERLFRRALDGREKSLGLEHSDTAQAAHDFSLFCATQGRLEEAQALAQKAVAAAGKSLPLGHRDRLTYEQHATGLHKAQRNAQE